MDRIVEVDPVLEVDNDPLCDSCIHRHADGSTRCTAFPRAIPGLILTGAADHREPYPGDRGIRYAPKEP